jgi:hypothetical protein
MQGPRAIARRFTSAHGIAVVALVLALGGGTVYAARQIGAGDIRKGAIRSKQIRNGAVKTPDLGKRAVKRGKIAPGAVGLRQLGVAARWEPIALAPGYASFAATGTSFGPPECFRDPFGIVHLRGAAENAGTGTGRVGELPPACWVETGAAANRFEEFLVTRINSLGVGQAAEPAYVDADTGEIFLENPVADNAGVAFAGIALGN